MPQQRLATFDERFKGSSFARVFFDDAAQDRDFICDQLAVPLGQPVPLVYPDGVFAEVYSGVHIHSRIIPVQSNLGKR